MKFHNVNKSKLNIGDEVFFKNDKGEYGYAKLVKESKDENGMIRTFKFATLDGQIKEVTNIVWVCKPITTEKV